MSRWILDLPLVSFCGLCSFCQSDTHFLLLLFILSFLFLCLISSSGWRWLSRNNVFETQKRIGVLSVFSTRENEKWIDLEILFERKNKKEEPSYFYLKKKEWSILWIDVFVSSFLVFLPVSSSLLILFPFVSAVDWMRTRLGSFYFLPDSCFVQVKEHWYCLSSSCLLPLKLVLLENASWQFSFLPSLSLSYMIMIMIGQHDVIVFLLPFVCNVSHDTLYLFSMVFLSLLSPVLVIERQHCS